MVEKTCCVTGHRDIPLERMAYVREELRRELLAAVEDGYTHFLSGFAQGVDLMFAAAVVELREQYSDLFLEAAIPYRNRLNTPDKTVQSLLRACNGISVHSETYAPSCFFTRNRYMVSLFGRVIAVYDNRTRGGTLSTLRYARSQEKDVRVIAL